MQPVDGGGGGGGGGGGVHGPVAVRLTVFEKIPDDTWSAQIFALLGIVVVVHEGIEPTVTPKTTEPLSPGVNTSAFQLKVRVELL